MVTIYGDEAGYTGNDLSNPEQKYFCYSTVCITEEEATQIVLDLRKQFRFQESMVELKGAVISKRKDAKTILETLLSRLSGSFLLTAARKDYVVCCKLFEYVFEPVVAPCSSVFYSHHFHRFLANLFYLEYASKNPLAFDLFEDLTQYLRWGRIESFKILFRKDRIAEANEPLRDILQFALNHKNIILSEFRSTDTGEIDVPGWLLDLAITDIGHMLARWGERHDELTFIHDESKALETDYAKGVFGTMVQRSGPTRYVNFFKGEPEPITFNLKGMPISGNSKEYTGIQLADLLSSFLYQALNNESDTLYEAFLPYSETTHMIGPDSGYVDFGNAGTWLNSMTLHEIPSLTYQQICKEREMARLYRDNAILLRYYVLGLSMEV